MWLLSENIDTCAVQLAVKIDCRIHVLDNYIHYNNGKLAQHCVAYFNSLQISTVYSCNERYFLLIFYSFFTREYCFSCMRQPLSFD